MPFRSENQRKFMYAKHPEIAKRWSKKYGNAIAMRKAGKNYSAKAVAAARKLRG